MEGRNLIPILLNEFVTWLVGPVRDRFGDIELQLVSVELRFS